MEFPTKPAGKSNVSCCVPQCKSRAGKDRTLSFHRFPREKEKVTLTDQFGQTSVRNRQKEWIRLLRIGKPVSPIMVVCSRHFTEADYYDGCVYAKLRRLRNSALPSQNLPDSAAESEKIRQKMKMQIMYLVKKDHNYAMIGRIQEAGNKLSEGGGKRTSVTTCRDPTCRRCIREDANLPPKKLTSCQLKIRKLQRALKCQQQEIDRLRKLLRSHYEKSLSAEATGVGQTKTVKENDHCDQQKRGRKTVSGHEKRLEKEEEESVSVEMQLSSESIAERQCM